MTTSVQQHFLDADNPPNVRVQDFGDFAVVTIGGDQIFLPSVSAVSALAAEVLDVIRVDLERCREAYYENEGQS